MSDDVYRTLRCKFDRHSLCTTPQLATCECECHDLTLDLGYEDSADQLDRASQPLLAALRGHTG